MISRRKTFGILAGAAVSAVIPSPSLASGGKELWRGTLGFFDFGPLWVNFVWCKRTDLPYRHTIWFSENNDIFNHPAQEYTYCPCMTPSYPNGTWLIDTATCKDPPGWRNIYFRTDRSTITVIKNIFVWFRPKHLDFINFETGDSVRLSPIQGGWVMTET